MAILASIQVHVCDGCGAIATVVTDADCDRFAAEWIATEEEDFCPTCAVEIAKWEALEGNDAQGS